MDRNQTLDTAKAAVNRAPKSYGNPREHFERVARHWNAHLFGRGFHCVDRLTPTDVAIMLGQVKVARLEHDPQHEDSWCDWAGYAACGAEVSEPAFSMKGMPDYKGVSPTVEFSAKPSETTADAADRAMKQGAAGLSWSGSPWWVPQTVKIVPPPLPESKFGFTIGETVNAKGEDPGHYPGTVLGFNDHGILVKWVGLEPQGVTWYPNELRHGA